VVGEMCPLLASGRPGVTALLLRGVQWIDEPTEVGNAISHGEATRFSVFGVDGKRAGVFEALGIADLGLPQTVAAGSYVGSGPCTRAGNQGVRLEDPQCQTATRGCGIAVASLGDAQHDGWKPGGACISGEDLAVDIDGDGKAESFPVTGLLDGVRGPADTMDARAGATATCTASFTLFGVRIAPPAEAGKANDPRYLVLVDVLAVVDFDRDGRRELVLALRYPDSRSIVVYSATNAPTTLTLIGEASSWSR
jgi:hypothetical protein